MRISDDWFKSYNIRNRQLLIASDSGSELGTALHQSNRQLLIARD